MTKDQALLSMIVAAGLSCGIWAESFWAATTLTSVLFFVLFLKEWK